MYFALVCLFGFANAHSWVEQLTNIASNGTFVGAPGYARGNVMRTDPGFSDVDMTNLIPPDGTAEVVTASDPMCHPSQSTTQNQTSGSPRLQTTAGAAIALRYQENGHVTLPWNQPGKPANRGTMYVYGTTQPLTNETLLAVHGVWNANGTGGDGRGVLLSTQSFDDGRCYQVNGGNISVARQAEYPHVANDLMGADLWCQQDIALPSNLAANSTYTLYWVWDWPTAANVDPDIPNGKPEIYTTCIDVDVSSSTTAEADIKVATGSGYVEGQSLDSASIPDEFDDLSNTGAVATESVDALTTAVSSTSVAAAATSSPATTSCTVGTSVVTETEIVYVTEYVTATAAKKAKRSQEPLGGVSPSSTATQSTAVPGESSSVGPISATTQVATSPVMPYPYTNVSSTSFADPVTTITIVLTSTIIPSEAINTAPSGPLSASSSMASPTFRVRGRNSLF